MKVPVSILKKTLYEFTVEAVIGSTGEIDIEATEEKASEVYEKALNDGTLENHYSDEDYEYEIGDIM